MTMQMNLKDIRVFRRNAQVECLRAEKGKITWSTAVDNAQIVATVDPISGVVTNSNGLIAWDLEKLTKIKGGNYNQPDHEYTIRAYVEFGGAHENFWDWERCLFKDEEADSIEYTKPGLA